MERRKNVIAINMYNIFYEIVKLNRKKIHSLSTDLEEDPSERPGC